jgi:hypothetical protein
MSNDRQGFALDVWHCFICLIGAMYASTYLDAYIAPKILPQ